MDSGNKRFVNLSELTQLSPLNTTTTTECLSNRDSLRVKSFVSLI